jgi:hypothetical protein
MLGLPSVLLAAVTSAAGFSSWGKVSGALAIIVGALTAVTTFLNPRENVGAHRQAWAKYDALRSRARMLGDLEYFVDAAPLDDNTKALVEQLRTLNNTLVDLGQSRPQVPQSVYNSVRKNSQLDELIRPAMLGGAPSPAK